MSRLMLLLKPRSDAALLLPEALLPEHLMALGTAQGVRARLSALFPALKWSGNSASVGSTEFRVDPADLTSISLRVVGNLDEYSWLRALELAFEARVYDAQTGGWFQEANQRAYLAYHARVIKQET
jgi:hypothetical protein